jgi:hypothetical protein
VHRAVHVGGFLLRSARASEERILGISPRARQNCVRITGAGVARIQHPNCVGLKADPQGSRALLWVGLQPDKPRTQNGVGLKADLLGVKAAARHGFPARSRASRRARRRRRRRQ